MTPDLLAGLLIGSFAIYACWLLSLRHAEHEDWEMGCGCKIAGLNGPYPHPNTWQGMKDAHPEIVMGDPPTGAFDVTCDGPPDDDPDCHCLGVTCPECRPNEPHFADCPIQADRIGDALVLLDKAFSDDA